MATQPHNRRRRTRPSQPVVAAFQPLEDRRLMSAVVIEPAVSSATITAAATGTTVTGYTPAQVRAAYGLSSVTGTGAGQTIAIVDAYNDPNLAADLATFDAKFGLAAAKLTVVGQAGSTTGLPATNAGWAQEISLDVEWAHAIAPGASLLLVEAKSSGTSDLLSAVNYARSASGVAAVSMSWGSSEFNGETGYDTDFTTPSGHAGVTFVAASGDSGSSSGAEWPASSAYVLSVGGTSLSATSTGTYTSEAGWSGSGGGKSRYEGEPSYQSAVQSNSVRTVPDVSYDASASTGFAVYDSLSSGGSSGWLEFGGTSAAAPQWAAIVAVADGLRSAAGKAALDGATNLLPALYSLASNSTTYAADFHDVTAGSSGAYSAATGYDLVTGIGTPKAAGLISALVASTTYTKVTLTSVPTTTTTPPGGGYGRGPGGPGGGGFGSRSRGFARFDEQYDRASVAPVNVGTATALTPTTATKVPQVYAVALAVNAPSATAATAAAAAAGTVAGVDVAGPTVAGFVGTGTASGGSDALATPTALPAVAAPALFADAGPAVTSALAPLSFAAATSIGDAGSDFAAAPAVATVADAALPAAAAGSFASQLDASNRTLGTAAGVLLGAVALATWAGRRRDEDQDAADRAADASPFGSGLIRFFEFA